VTTIIEKMRQAARALKSEIAVLAAAVRDGRTPWYAKALGALIIGYALSPIDLIPDFIPVLGLLDDLILLPLGIWAVRRMIPAAVLAEHRAKIAAGARLPPNRRAAAVIIVLWLVGVVLTGWWLWQHFAR
jgi:uncharacterized membrane protein YkvA (DUF1232 family)